MAATGDGILSQAASDLTGKIETAYLVVHDYRSIKEKKQLQMTSPNQSGVSLMDAAKANAIMDDPTGPGLSAADRKIFRVQFNPSQIHLYTAAPAHTISNVTKSGNQQNTDTNNQPRIEMTLPLVFDAMNPADSFMLDKFTAGVSAQQIVNITSAAKGKVYSVQPQMEGLVAILRNPFTRQVTFHWGDFEFFGQVRQIMANYTMFSVTGRPVRGQITLRITQRANKSSDLASWTESFQKAFGGSGAGSFVRDGQRTSNLLNFNVK